MDQPRISVLAGGGARMTWLRPDPDLAAEVDGYWRMDVDRPPATVQVVPDGLVDLTFDLTEPDRPQSWVTGPRAAPATYTHHRPTRFVGLSLRPGVAARVLGVRMGSLSQEWTSLPELVGPVAGELTERVSQADRTGSAFAVLDTFLMARLAGCPTDDRVRTAVGLLLERGGDVGIETLAQQSAASPRTLGRLFDTWVGLSPKQFARIARAQAALRRIAQTPDVDLTRLAAELGFADHPHLARELRTLVGRSPSELADSFKPRTEQSS